LNPSDQPNPEFLLAATYQKAPADPRVPTTDYYDNQSTQLVADSSEMLMTGHDAFTGLTKCTYFLSTEIASGLAPAWRLVASNNDETTSFFDYDLVVSEYFTLELEQSSASGTPYVLPTGVAKVPNYNMFIPAYRSAEVSVTWNEIISEDGGYGYYGGGSEESMRPRFYGCSMEGNGAYTRNMTGYNGYQNDISFHTCAE